MAQPLRMAWRGGADGKCSAVFGGFAISALAANTGSALADGMAASFAAAIMAGSLPRTPGLVTGARSTDANGTDGVEPIGAAAASVSASASSLAGPVSSAVCTVCGFGSGAFFGGTSLTTTVLTLTGVSGAVEPGEIAAATS